jgi:hypothetical protein
MFVAIRCMVVILLGNLLSDRRAVGELTFLTALEPKALCIHEFPSAKREANTRCGPHPAAPSSRSPVLGSSKIGLTPTPLC